VVLWTAIEFVLPAFVDAKEGCVDFQGAAAGMIGTVDFKAIAVIDAAGDFEDHGVVEEVGTGEAETLVAVGEGEVDVLIFVHRCVWVIDITNNRTFILL